MRVRRGAKSNYIDMTTTKQKKVAEAARRAAGGAPRQAREARSSARRLFAGAGNVTSWNRDVESGFKKAVGWRPPEYEVFTLAQARKLAFER